MSIQTCVSCGRQFERAYDGPGAPQTCPVCALSRAPIEQARPAPPPQPAAVVAAAFPVTVAIVGLNVLVYVVMVLRGASPLLPSPQDAIRFGADVGALTFGGQWWRLITSMFVHFGIFHIGLNMWCLWNLGRAAERLMGRFSYLLAYMVSGTFGSIASVYWHPEAAGAGASGAIFGLAGVLVSYIYLKKTPSNLQLNSRFLGSLGTFIFYNLVFGEAVHIISNAAHIGGLVMGLVVGALLPSSSAPESSRRARLSLVVGFSVLALTASFLYAKRVKSGASELTSIRHLLSTGKTDEALKQLQELTTREPGLAQAQSMLGTIYFSRQNYPAGLTAFEKAYADDPKDQSIQRKLGAAYLTLGKFEQANAYYKTLVAANSNDALTHLGLGQSYLSMGQFDSAIPEFQKAVALKPEMPQPRHMLAQAQIRAGRFADAQQTYTRLVQQFPEDPQARAGLNFTRKQTGQ